MSDRFDGVAIHPYSYPVLPTADRRWNTFANLPELRALLVERGDGDKLLWGTEFGAPTGTSERAVSQEQQVRILVDAYDAWAQWSWVGPLLWYANRDAGDDPADPEDNFGLLRVDGRPKLAAEVFPRLLRTDATEVGRRGRPDESGGAAPAAGPAR